MNAGPETWRSVLIWYQKPISTSLPDHLSNPFNTITSCGPIGFLGSTMALVPKEGLKASTAEVRNVLCTGVRWNVLQAEDVWCIKEVVQAHRCRLSRIQTFFWVHLHKMQQLQMLLTFWSQTYRWDNAKCYKLGSRKKLLQMYRKTVFSKDMCKTLHEIFNRNSIPPMKSQWCDCNFFTYQSYITCARLHV